MLLRSEGETNDAQDERAVDTAYVQQGPTTIKGIDGMMYLGMHVSCAHMGVISRVFITSCMFVYTSCIHIILVCTVHHTLHYLYTPSVPPNRGPRRRPNATRGPVVHGSAASYGGRGPPRPGGGAVSLPLSQTGVGLVIPYDELQVVEVEDDVVLWCGVLCLGQCAVCGWCAVRVLYCVHSSCYVSTSFALDLLMPHFPQFHLSLSTTPPLSPPHFLSSWHRWVR